MLTFLKHKKLVGKFDIVARETDVFLVSFPRSGNTWLRFLLGKLLIQDKELNRHTLEEIVPDIYKSKNWIENYQKDPRFIKTHEFNFESYPKTIYIVRDGRDVMVSNYYYSFPFEVSRPSFSQFLSDREFNSRDSWGQHVETFLRFQRKSPFRSCLVRYEDLVSNTAAELVKIAKFCGIPFSSEGVEDAVKYCAIDNLKKVSAEKGAPYAIRNGVEMFREGKVGGWTQLFSAQDSQKFLKKNRKIMNRFGYDF